MPAFEIDDVAIHIPEAESIGRFTPVTREHILNCSYDKWYPRYKAFCPPSKVITLSQDFIAYLSEDGIVLADDDVQGQDADEDGWEPQNPSARYHDDDDDLEAASDSDEEQGLTPRLPPNKRFADLHQLIKDAIRDLGGAVAPKLNWSAPKDATYMAFGNDMKCTTPNDIYLLLKSSSFVSHDLDQPFEGCALSQQNDSTIASAKSFFQPVLVLRKFLDIRTAMEFRCFVKHRNLIAITPRDMKHYDFQEKLRPVILSRARELFNARLRYNFPDSSFVFDMYIPDSHLDDSGLGRARLIDINPWAPTTDSLLFDWRELLQLRVAKPILGTAGEEIGKDDDQETAEDDEDDEDDESTSDEEEDDFDPEFRLVEKQDARFNMMAADYSAHKLPKEVVDASLAGPGGLRDFMQQWQELVDGSGQR